MVHGVWCMVWYGMVWYGMVWYGMVGSHFTRAPSWSVSTHGALGSSRIFLTRENTLMLPVVCGVCGVWGVGCVWCVWCMWCGLYNTHLSIPVCHCTTYA